MVRIKRLNQTYNYRRTSLRFKKHISWRLKRWKTYSLNHTRNESLPLNQTKDEQLLAMIASLNYPITHLMKVIILPTLGFSKPLFTNTKSFSDSYNFKLFSKKLFSKLGLDKIYKLNLLKIMSRNWRVKLQLQLLNFDVKLEFVLSKTLIYFGPQFLKWMNIILLIQLR